MFPDWFDLRGPLTLDHPVRSSAPAVTARATFAASPKLVAGLVELIAEARKAAEYDQHTAE
ncbi:hypothetical protein GCM10022224_077420 [Nonomuraea antimicrobica]|uniref:Uncharacterized protein n=1 Tax=Nonomuraea antimicrobica TaxID=561173 RepID=A0ABP7D6K4_9ACTN